MNNQQVTQAIVLHRTNYGEADRILTLLTPDKGKLRLMARGVRRSKSKLAGGIELFSTTDITFVKGRGDLGTLISTRLLKHYGNIAKNIDRVQLGYDLIKMLDRAIEDEPESEYYHLLEQAFTALDDASIDLELIRSWLQAQLLRQAGHTPNLQTDAAGKALKLEAAYIFDFEAMGFHTHPEGSFTADHIKTLRLLFSENPLLSLHRVQGLLEHVTTVTPLVRTMTSTYIRL
ncbi:MAG TPA: DNA repair protein RecO [Candidatus Saccharimonadales bacterium]